jgi:Zn-finger nucleic acid-binding protein
MLRSLERLTAAQPEHERYGIEVIGCQRCGDVWERRGAGRVLPASPDPDLVKRERR